MDESQYQIFSGYGLLIGTSFIGMKIGVDWINTVSSYFSSGWSLQEGN